MPRFMLKNRLALIAIACTIYLAGGVSAQTDKISYQGKLMDAGSPANGTYDFVFKLYNSNGVQFSVDVVMNDVQVTNGLFNVLIPFDTSPGIFLVGSQKFLEILVRPGASTGAYTTLAPRQEFGSVPSAISSRHALNAGFADNAGGLNGTPAGNFVQTTDTRLSDARPPTAGSANYIQNGTGIQPLSNFNISGSGTVGGTLTVNIVRATQLNNVHNERVLIASDTNVAVGRFAGSNVSPTGVNTFMGASAGHFTTGTHNTMVGANTGFQNTTGGDNAFFGHQAGEQNQTANFNSFFGSKAGLNTSTGALNSFFGGSAGQLNTTGARNVFLGINAGIDNTTGNDNTIAGTNANVGSNNLTNATAIGAKAFVTQSNSLVLGGINGVNSSTVDTNVGIGTTAPAARLHVNGQVRVTNGPVYIANPHTLVITSPNGACWGITVNDSGALATFPVNPCP